MKSIFFNLIILIGLAFSQAQNCNDELSMFNESAKAKIYSDALPRYDKLLNECPDIGIALYVRADKMFEDLIDEEKDKEKVKTLINRKIDNLKLRLKYLPAQSPIGRINAEIALTMYDNEIGSADEQFAIFDEAWAKDPENFKSPKAIYVYFLLYNNYQDEGKKDLNDLFVKYDELQEQIELMKDEQASVANALIIKEQNGEKLTLKERRILSNTEIYLNNYSKIVKGMNKIIGDKVECKNIIPLYTKDFEEKKANQSWLKTVASRLNAQDCTSDPLFVRVVEALNEIEPSSKTLKYLGILSLKNKDFTKAKEFFKEALTLEKDNAEKAKLNFLIADVYKDQKSFSTANSYYKKALDLKPSLGLAYLRIADMIAKSANDCGDTTFKKQAVYWVAYNYANRAASVDANIKDIALQNASRYNQLAPSTSDVFQNDMGGKTITFSCWFGGSTIVPSIKKD